MIYNAVGDFTQDSYARFTRAKEFFEWAAEKVNENIGDPGSADVTGYQVFLVFGGGGIVIGLLLTFRVELTLAWRRIRGLHRSQHRRHCHCRRIR